MSKRLGSLFILVALVVSSSAYALPKTVYLIRHAEKVSDDYPDLSKRGWERARALPKLFKRPQINQYGIPVAIYAMAPKDEDGSVRSIQTVSSLSRVLKLKTDSTYTSKETSDLVWDILHDSAYDGKAVFIAWNRAGVIKLARKFGARNVPGEWYDTVFDRIWVIHNPGSSQVTWDDLPQKLLSGDSAR